MPAQPDPDTPLNLIYAISKKKILKINITIYLLIESDWQRETLFFREKAQTLKKAKAGSINIQASLLNAASITKNKKRKFNKSKNRLLILSLVDKEPKIKASDVKKIAVVSGVPNLAQVED